MPVAYKCRLCGIVKPLKWTFRCPGCGSFADIRQVNEDIPGAQPSEVADGEVVSLQDAVDQVVEIPRIETGLLGMDYVLGNRHQVGFAKNGLYLLTGDPGAGKCLGRGTPVLRFDGTIVPVEQVRPGDVLMGPDSTPRKVLSTAVGVGPLYKIVPIKGEPWICNDAHILTLVHSGKDTVVDVPLDEYLRNTREDRCRWKLFQPPEVVFPDAFVAEDRPVSPYFLGVWLGDGTKEEREDGKLCGISVSKPDAEIEQACQEEASYFNLTVSTLYTHDCPRHSIVGSSGRENPLTAIFRRLMDKEVRVPPAYLYGSLDVRREVLAGLLDTDGYFNNGYYEIAQKSDAIADDIAFLARSVGLRVSRRIKIVKGNPYHRLHLSGDAAALPLRIPRKQPRPRKQIKNALRTGFTVEPLGEGEYFGFTLDSDGRFLLGDFTVTHNTTVLIQTLQAAARLRYDALYITGEQTVGDLALRARSFGKIPARMVAVRETDLDVILDIIDERQPAIVVVDSAQTIFVDDELEVGGAASIKVAIRELMKAAKETNTTIIVIGHVTKGGAIGGPKALEHYVDCSFHLSGTKTSKIRTLRCDSKNRFGDTPRQARFTMGDDGLTALDKFAMTDHGLAKIEAGDEDEDEPEEKSPTTTPEKPTPKKSRPKLVSVPLDVAPIASDTTPLPKTVLPPFWTADDGTSAAVVLAVKCDEPECKGKVDRACTAENGAREAGFHASRITKGKLYAAGRDTAPTEKRKTKAELDAEAPLPPDPFTVKKFGAKPRVTTKPRLSLGEPLKAPPRVTKKKPPPEKRPE